MAYGDYDNVTRDAKQLTDILARQGSGIFLEVLADSLGDSANKFSLTPVEVQRVVDANCVEYRELVAERT